MIAAIKAEFRKLFTTRMWWILAIIMIAYLAFMSLIMGLAFTATDDISGGMLGGKSLAITIYSLVNPIGYVFPLIIGSLVFTGEFRHKTITSTLLVEPNRTVLLFAKLAVSVILGLVYGVIAIASTIAGAAPFLEILGDGAYLGDVEVWKLVASAVWVFVLWSMLGVVLGGLIVNQVASIIIILAMTQLVEPILGLGLAAWGPTQTISQYLPGAAGSSVLGSSFMDMGMGLTEQLSRLEGSLVLLAYVAVFALAARFITLTRDIG